MAINKRYQRYVGRIENGIVVPFKGHCAYVFDMESDPFVFLFADGSTREAKNSGWSRKIVLNLMKLHNWGFMTPSRMKHFFPNLNMSQTQIIGAPAPTPSVPEKLALRKGLLYFNTTTKQVNRVVKIDEEIIYTTYHRQEIRLFPRNAFRKATTEEVQYYLKAA